MKHDIYAEHWKTARSQALQKGWQIIEHGWEQHVIIDEVARLVYRYPRHSAAAAKLDDEVAVLQALHMQVWPYELPVMKEHNNLFSSYDLIVGEAMGPELIARLSEDQLDIIAAQLGELMVPFHHFDMNIVDLKKTKQTTTLLSYYTERIRGATDTPFFDQASQTLQKLIKNSNRAKKVVIHGDLHGLNIIVNRENELQGIIDLSEIETGDPHQDFRKVFMTDARLLDPALAAYRKHGGQQLDVKVVKLWAYVNEWANLCYFAGSPSNPTYLRALMHMKKWKLL